jgi:hypothetical protein
VGVRHGLHRPCNRELEGGGVQQQLRRAPEHRSAARPSSGLNELLFRGKFLKRWVREDGAAVACACSSLAVSCWGARLPPGARMLEAVLCWVFNAPAGGCRRLNLFNARRNA